MKVALINHGKANIQALVSVIYELNHTPVLIENGKDLSVFEYAILPGIGYFGSVMDTLRQKNLDYYINAHVNQGRKLLGICVGMQALFSSSDEGMCDGLGLLPHKVTALHKNAENLVPHIGWNTVVASDQGSKLLENMPADYWFYFAHSYGVQYRGEAIFSYVEHARPTAAIVEHENIFGTQFHPEKSHKFGLQLIKNYLSA